MSKFGLQDLAAAIAKKHGLEQDKTEVLVKTFFETIEEGLYEDKSVKIKGLGTFKVVEVEPRESVNVNTGERVVIEGHEKINFSPEAALKDLVNKPFAQFETVVLNDGTDFSGLKNNPEELLENLDDDPFSMTENTEDGYERNSVKKPLKGEGTDTQVKENELSMDVLQEISETSDNEDVSIDESEPEDQEEPIHILSESPEETSMPETVVEDAPLEEKTITEEPVSQEQPADQPEVTDQNESVWEEESVTEKTVEKETGGHELEKEVSDEDESGEDESDEDEGDETKKSHKINDTILIIVIALVCFVGGYMTSAFFTLDNLISIFNSEQVEKSVAQKKVSTPPIEKPVAVTKANPVQKNAGDQPKVNENAVSTPSKEVPVEKSQPKKNSTNFDSEKYDNANRQVKYGAYRIVGVDKTIKLKLGQTLSYIAQRDFGSKEMLCYILALNGMNADTQVKEGQTILIPKLELRHKREK